MLFPYSDLMKVSFLMVVPEVPEPWGPPGRVAMKVFHIEFREPEESNRNHVSNEKFGPLVV